MFKKIVIIIFLLILFFKFVVPVKAEECSFSCSDLNDCAQKINNCRQEWDARSKAHETNKETLTTLQNQVGNYKKQIDKISLQLNQKQTEISKTNKDFDQEYEQLSAEVRAFYIENYKNNLMVLLLGSQNMREVLRNLSAYSFLVKRDKEAIINLTTSLINLQKEKKILAETLNSINAFKVAIDKEADSLSIEVEKVDKFKNQVFSAIVSLTAKQQQFLGQRLSGLNLPRSAGTGAPACVDDRDIDPGFSPRFAFFTYGVTNRVGLNQYGAFGRAKAGQNAEDILRVYYNDYELKKDYNQDISISVDGYGSLKIEDYLKHLGEMPESWGNQGGFEALKAQAIAARSYALAYTNNGQGSICGTDLCQVFLSNEKGGKWNEAVEATKGWVMVQGGSPIKAWFSSTHGGYIHSSADIGWNQTSFTKNAKDTTTDSINSFNDLKNNAYDKDSPWFYCDWGARAIYNKTAWLKSSEVADVVNVILLARADSSRTDHFYQTDKKHPYGGEVWNEERVKSELRSRDITPFNNITDISVSADFGSGKINSVNVSGDAGSQQFNGSEFKDWFNLRASANIQIVGPLFNIEKR